MDEMPQALPQASPRANPSLVKCFEALSTS